MPRRALALNSLNYARCHVCEIRVDWFPSGSTLLIFNLVLDVLFFFLFLHFCMQPKAMTTLKTFFLDLVE